MLRVFKWFVAVIFTVTLAFGAVVLLTMYEELTETLPTIDRLLEYDPPVATRVFAADGSLLEEFYRERRYRVPIAEIPPMVRNAFLAAEDADFFAHRGVDVIGIVRAFVANMRAGDVVQGASTITQQVVKALLLSPERSYERKAKEILLSVRLEQHLTKEQILELYLNQIYFGDGNHGVGAAARNYFGKSVEELTVAEAAMLAGLPAAPSRYSPNRNPEAATSRQHYVLRRMVEEGFLSSGEYQAAMREQVRVSSPHRTVSPVRDYYTETVRLQLETMFGAEAPYNQGYTVHTAMQPRLQSLAEMAVRNGIERVDLALGYRGPLSHPTDEEAREIVARTKAEIESQALDPERIYQAVVTRAASGKIDVTVGPHQATVDTSSVRWSGRARSRTFKVGDVVEVRTREPAKASVAHAGLQTQKPEGDAAAPPKFFLAQTPEIEAALVAIDMEDGGIAALVGGYDFLASQFNRALQALRQPGSAFKPFVYAAALDNGFTAASILQDTPVEYKDNDKLWQPRNYTRDYKGPISLRTALEQSRNVVSVKLVEAMGPKSVVDYLARFRLNARFGENLSLGLGTTEMTLRDLTEGYTAFANGGVKVEPVIIRRIEDKEGKPFFTDEPRRREVLSPATAALMTYILRGVVERGTATSIKALERPVAGKTGTTNEQRDAFFIGYTPNLAVGVWVGFDDQNQTMGKMGTGGRVAAPIWLDFMKPALAGTPVRDFEIPEDIACVNIDPDNGKRAAEWTEKPFLECFKQGTEPGTASHDDVVSTPRSDEKYGSASEPGDEIVPPVDGEDPYDPDFAYERRPPPAGADPRWPSERDVTVPPADRWSPPPIPPAPERWRPPAADERAMRPPEPERAMPPRPRASERWVTPPEPDRYERGPYEPEARRREPEARRREPEAYRREPEAYRREPGAPRMEPPPIRDRWAPAPVPPVPGRYPYGRPPEPREPPRAESREQPREDLRNREEEPRQPERLWGAEPPPPPTLPPDDGVRWFPRTVPAPRD